MVFTDNNNTFNNNQSSNNHKNFNAYQPQEIPQPQVLPQSYYTPVQPQQSYYAPVQPQRTSNTNGILSIVLGLFGCCSGLPAVVGLIFGIIGVKNNKNDTLSIVGLVINVLVIVFWVIAFGWQIYKDIRSDLLKQLLNDHLTAQLEQLESVETAIISSIK